MIKTKCSGCKDEYDAEYMIIQDEETIYCPVCDYAHSANLDNLTDEE